MNTNILVVEDDKDVRAFLCDALSSEGHTVSPAKDADDGVNMAQSNVFDLLVVDLKLPQGRSGIEVLKAAKQHDPEAAVVILTAHADVKSAVEAIKLGAADYVEKPSSRSEILVKVRKALDQAALRQRASELEAERHRTASEFEMVGTSELMTALQRQIGKVARSDIAVLVTGETGVGKELVARAIHQASPRASRPFVAIDCNITESVAEAELFGVIANFPGFHRKEALVGRFEQANGGTLFLDEVGDLPPAAQTRLLRVLENKEIYPLGASGSRRIDIRVVAATNRDLDQAVRDGKFRKDFLFRLNAASVRVPPLRERKEDIQALAEHFLKVFSRQLKRKLPSIAPEAMDILLAYEYPGNVRELKNVIELAIVLSEGCVIKAKDLRISIPDEEAAQASLDVGMSKPFRDAKADAVEAFEKRYLTQAMEACDRNISEAAKKAGMDRGNFSQKLKKYGIASRYARKSEAQ